MPPPHDILILRDPRESIRRCSLTPLRGMECVRFVSYRPELELDASGRVLLHPDGEPFTEGDAESGLFLIDCSWRRVDSLMRTVRGEPRRRRLPTLRTAYPRRSSTFSDPATGLASIEALYAATALFGEPWPELIAAYRWREEFLAANPELPR